MAASTKRRPMRKKQKLSDVSVDDFLSHGFDLGSENDSNQEDGIEQTVEKKTQLKQKKKIKKTLDGSRSKIIKKKQKIQAVENGLEQDSKMKKKKTKLKKKVDIDTADSEEKMEHLEKPKKKKKSLKKRIQEEEEQLESDEEDVDMDNASDDSSEDIEGDIDRYKNTMKQLKESDPDFYNYLEKNDKKLLRFDINEDEEEEEEEEEDFSEEEGDQQEVPKKVTVTEGVIEKMKSGLKESPDVQLISNIMQCFRAAVAQASGDESSVPSCRYKVEGETVFNAIIQLCLVDLLPAVNKALRLPQIENLQDGAKPPDPSKSHGWKKLKVPIKSYLIDVIKMISVVAEPQLITVLLRHVLYLVPFYIAFPQIAKILLKKMVNFWSTGEPPVRVLAFLCIVRVTRYLPPEYLNVVSRQMYMSYVKNCKFTSPTTLPLINFMKRSLVEVYALNQNLAYQHAFIYIRQLAIHLRNAMKIKKKDAFQAVYNWQYTHCCLLWIHLLATVHPSEILHPLVYPLIQTVIGTIKLIPAAKYMPLRFHLIRALIHLSSETRIFIPILPFLLEVFTLINFDKKSTSLKMKPINLSCILKASQSQLKENGFKDAVVDSFCELSMEYLNSYSHTLGFPELTLPMVIQLKEFLKNCKSINYTQHIKQLLEKTEENSKFIMEKRKHVNVQLTNTDTLDLLENKLKNEGTPLSKFYNQRKKLQEHHQKLAVEGMIKKDENEAKENQDDSDDEEEEENLPPVKKTSSKKTKPKVKTQLPSKTNVDRDEEAEDIVENMSLSSTSDEEETSEESSEDESSNSE